MIVVDITGGMLRAGRAPVASRSKIWPARANRDASRAANGAESRSAKSYDSAARLLLSTLTDELAFRRISRIDAPVLPIQIEQRWRDIAARSYCSGIKWNDTRGTRAAHVIVRRALAKKDDCLQFRPKLDW